MHPFRRPWVVAGRRTVIKWMKLPGSRHCSGCGAALGEPHALLPLPAIRTFAWDLDGGGGQLEPCPKPPLLSSQRFRKAIRPLSSWRSASSRELPHQVIDVPYTVNLTDSDFVGGWQLPDRSEA